MWRVFAAWILCLAVLIAGALLVCPSGRCSIGQFDLVGLGLAQDQRGVTLDYLMQGVTWLGSLALLLPLMVLLASALVSHGYRHEAGFVLLALLGASVLSHLTKLWVMRPRPDLYAPVLSMPSDWSYPSAHSMQAVAAALALFLVAGRQRTVSLALSLICVVLLVGWSRIYLQVHFPSDVVVGILAGAFWVFGLHALMFSQLAVSGKHRATGGTP